MWRSFLLPGQLELQFLLKILIYYWQSYHKVSKCEWMNFLFVCWDLNLCTAVWHSIPCYLTSVVTFKVLDCHYCITDHKTEHSLIELIKIQLFSGMTPPLTFQLWHFLSHYWWFASNSVRIFLIEMCILKLILKKFT